MLPKIAIVGATGVVGRTLLDVLTEYDVKADYMLLSSDKSKGTLLNVCGKTLSVNSLSDYDFKTRFNYAVFCAGKDVSNRYIDAFTANGTTVIDNSSCFRRYGNVPLVAFGVNHKIIKPTDKIIANPNCSTIQAVNVIKPIFDNFGVKRIVYTTMQAVSGAGRKGILDLESKTYRLGGAFPYCINSNCIPKIGEFLPDGYTEEEDKLIFETRKILDDKDLPVTATAVRVPVLVGHSISLNIQTKVPFDTSDIIETLKMQDNLVIIEGNDFPTALDVAVDDFVYVGRIRRDFSQENALNMWIVANNLRRGASVNAVEILRYLIDDYD